MLYENLNVNAKGHLTFGGLDTVDLAAQYGTPLLLMDEQRLRARCREYKAAMAAYLPAGSMPLYASKALSFKGMYRIMAEEKMGVDVVSPGELHTAVAAGFPMENAYFHGNSKTDGDIRFAMEHGIGCIVSRCRTRSMPSTGRLPVRVFAKRYFYGSAPASTPTPM